MILEIIGYSASAVLGIVVGKYFTTTERVKRAEILRVLRSWEGDSMYAMDMIIVSKKDKNAICKLSYGHIYSTLLGMENDGLIKHKEESSGRRTYTLA